MGSWFSNIHIRKSPDVAESSVTEAICALMIRKGYRKAENPDTAETLISILLPESSPWITVHGDVLTHDDPESCKLAAAPLSEQLHTDVLGIACFDSDFLYLNLLNSEQQIDGWIAIGAGKEVGITRRSNLSVWKKKVDDYPDFASKAKNKYVISDLFLQDTEANLGMSIEQSTFNGRIAQGRIIVLAFDQVTGDGKKPQMAHYNLGLPCFMDQQSSVIAVNIGEESKGLTVCFPGPYVERDEITFSDVSLHCQDYTARFELVKEQLDDGSWAYACHDPNFPIPPKVPKRLRKEKRAHLQYERQIVLCFTPRGNSRKMLDITVAFIPHENPQGNTHWNAWKSHGSKEAYIEHYNKINKRVRAFEDDPSQWLPYLKSEDFDD